MSLDTVIRKIFQDYNTIAVVGMSRSTDKPARRVPAFLLTKGYNIIPVNPFVEKIVGRKSYPNLEDIPEKIDIVEVFRPSEEALSVVKDAVKRKKLKDDIAVVWLQEGIRNEEARQLAEEAGIIFIQDRCMYKDYITFAAEK